MPISSVASPILDVRRIIAVLFGRHLFRAKYQEFTSRRRFTSKRTSSAESSIRSVISCGLCEMSSGSTNAQSPAVTLWSIASDFASRISLIETRCGIGKLLSLLLPMLQLVNTSQSGFAWPARLGTRAKRSVAELRPQAGAWERGEGLRRAPFSLRCLAS